MAYDIYPVSLQIALYFKNKIDPLKAFQTAQQIYSEDTLIEHDSKLEINNVIMIPNSPIIKLEKIDAIKQKILQIQSDRSDYLLNMTNNSIEESMQEFKKLLDNIECFYKFILNFCSNVNRIGIVSTFAMKQNFDINIDLCKREKLNAFNISMNYKNNIFDDIIAYDYIKIFNKVKLNKLPQPLLSENDILYIQRDINSGKYNSDLEINLEYVNKFKNKVIELTKPDELLKLLKGIMPDA